MALTDFLSTERIISVSPGSTEHIIQSLCAPLVADKTILDVNSFVKDVIDRERKFTTQIAPYFAFPHAHSYAVSRLGVVIGYTKNAEGIDYAINTPGKVRFFFLMAVPTAMPEAHLEIMALFANAISNEALVAKLLRAKSPAGILRVLGK